MILVERNILWKVELWCRQNGYILTIRSIRRSPFPLTKINFKSKFFMGTTCRIGRRRTATLLSLVILRSSTNTISYYFLRDNIIFPKYTVWWHSIYRRRIILYCIIHVETYLNSPSTNVLFSKQVRNNLLTNVLWWGCSWI